jgi:hypothetical protein
MRTSLVAFAALAALAAVPVSASAQVEINAAFRLGLPVAPPLVVIQPGVQVVQDHDDEIFVHGGTYWTRRANTRLSRRRALIATAGTCCVPS